MRYFYWVIFLNLNIFLRKNSFDNLRIDFGFIEFEIELFWAQDGLLLGLLNLRFNYFGLWMDIYFRLIFVSHGPIPLLVLF